MNGCDYLNNFIKIDRKILKWEWWNDINTSRLFIYMLIAANWKDNNYKGEVILFSNSYTNDIQYVKNSYNDALQLNSNINFKNGLFNKSINDHIDFIKNLNN